MPGQFILQYYVDSSRNKLKGSIDLDQCEQVDSGLTFECGKVKFQFMFDIRTPRRVYYLAADTEEDMATWVDLVCKVCGLHNYTSEPGGQQPQDEGQARSGEVPVTKQPGPAISGPYMHLSECFTGAQPPTSRTRASSVTSNLDTSNLYNDSLQCGDDSVFLPSSPATAGITAAMSQLGLSCPARPPKPANLRNTQLSQLSYPSCHSSNDNYENHEDLNTSSSNTKVETNNNCDTAANATFLPPTVDRRLKPERSVVSSPVNTIQGPPVERNRKPRKMSDNAATWAGHGMQVPRGMSIPGHASADTWQEDTCSEGGSLRGSSDEQIYFYMPSIQTQNMTSGPGGRWDPIMIPASELRDNAVQYLDLDLPATDSSLLETSGGCLSDRSSSRMRGGGGGGGETVYKTVDFVKTEAFNR